MLILPAAASALVTSALIAWLDRWARASGALLDVPNQRSSHGVSTPRVGGAAIAIGVGVGLAVAWAIGVAPVARSGMLVAGALVIAAMGFADDVRSLSVPLRLTAQAVVSGAVAIDIGPWPAHAGVDYLSVLSMAVGFVWIVGLANAYNFMDGIDGLAGGQAVVAGAGWAIVGLLTREPAVTVAALAIAAASAAFLGFNWPPARVFMGDAGSGVLGYAFAVLPMASGPSVPAFAAAALFVWPFLFDAVFTFLRRLARGENVVRAHRSHLYQRLVATGLSHRQVTATYLALAALGVPAGVCAATGSAIAAVIFGGLVACAAGWLWRAVVRREGAVLREEGRPTR